jgi:N-methylhydantoinase A
LPYRIGVDIGGTFTDLVALDERTGHLYNYKVSTTPTQPERGFIECLRRFLRDSKTRTHRVKSIVHATTVATNAIIGQAGLELPEAALITTEGFRDVLEIGRQNRPELYNFHFTKPKPLIPRSRRLEVKERVDHKGKVLQALAADEAQKIAQAVNQIGVKSVAVCLLHSYANSNHEELLGETLQATSPGLNVSLSHQILPELREYERTSTTVLNALLIPVLSRYLNELGKLLHDEGIDSTLYVMQSNGGMASSQAIGQVPARAIESGPAAGVIAASFLADQLAERNILSFDMGGTTAKAGLIRNGEIQVTTEYEVGGRIHSGRVVRGSGYPVKFPFVDLAEIGAGGGSIAWLDGADQLHVGPRSAGADPGPACYGQGGTEPTVTDAHVVLGQLNPSQLLGGDLKLKAELAQDALNKIAERLRLSLEETALGVLQIADSHLSKLLRIVTVERGHDPKDFLLVAFGGCGPMHASNVARELGIKKILIPASAGLASALGLLATDFIHDSVQTHLTNPEEADLDLLELQLRQMEMRAHALLVEEGVGEDDIVHIRSFDMRYAGQSHELEVNLEGRTIDQATITSAVEAFHSKHETTYGFSRPAEKTEIVNLRVKSIGVTTKPSLETKPEENYNPSRALKEKRPVFYPSGPVIECPIYERNRLTPGTILLGPAVLEDYDSTTLLLPRDRCAIDGHLNLIIEVP